LKEVEKILDATYSTVYCLGMTIMEQLAQAITNSGASRYRIHKDTGINQAVLHRIVTGSAGCNMDTFNILCEYLNLELVSKDRKEGK